MMDNQVKICNITAASILWVAVAWNAILLFSSTTLPFATAMTSPENIEILHFGDPSGVEEDLLLEQDLSSHYNVHYQIHYHHDDRQRNKELTPCWGELPKKRAKSTNHGVEYLYESNCDPTVSPSDSPVEKSTESSTFSPTIVILKRSFPSEVTTQTPTPEVSSEVNSDIFAHPTWHKPNDVTLHREKNTIPDSRKIHNASMGRSYWLVGAAAISITAFLGGFAASQTCSNKTKKPVTGGNITTNKEVSSSSDVASIQLSVEDSVDSYHIEDWSVSVVSWGTPNDEGIEVAHKPNIFVTKGTDDDVEEIEIEFHEGYDSSSSSDEEDPPLFDVIDLSNERKASF